MTTTTIEVSRRNLVSEADQYKEETVSLYRDIRKKINIQPLVPMMPIRVLAANLTKQTLSHIVYDVKMNKKKEKIVGLIPSQLDVHLFNICDFLQRLGGRRLTTKDVVMKVIKVLILHDMYHMDLFVNHFDEHARYKYGQLVIGDLQTELSCFHSAMSYLVREGDGIGIEICHILRDTALIEAGRGETIVSADKRRDKSVKRLSQMIR